MVKVLRPWNHLGFVRKRPFRLDSGSKVVDLQSSSGEMVIVEFIVLVNAVVLDGDATVWCDGKTRWRRNCKGNAFCVPW